MSEAFRDASLGSISWKVGAYPHFHPQAVAVLWNPNQGKGHHFMAAEKRVRQYLAATNTKAVVYRTFVMSTLLYSSEHLRPPMPKADFQNEVVR